MIIIYFFIACVYALPLPQNTQESFLIRILGQDCHTSLVQEWNIRDIDCVQLVISKLLGMAIVVGGAIVKIPQIITIIRHKSTQGLSLSSFILETTAYLIVMIYNARLDHPFNTYGEIVFMSLQNILITLFILQEAWSMFSVVAFFSVCSLCLFQASPTLMAVIYAAQIPLSLISKLPQIRMNYVNQSTGQLSLFSVLSYFIGTAARVFTTWTELDDPIMLMGSLIATFLNSILLLQFIYYYQSPWMTKAE